MTHEHENRDQPVDARVYLAVERTFLAWIRTGLALMGFGFVVARFGLLLRELSITASRETPAARGVSTLFGTGLVALGVVVTAAALYRYLHLLGRLDRGDTLRKPSRLAVAIGGALALIGALVCLYLLLVPA